MCLIWKWHGADEIAYIFYSRSAARIDERRVELASVSLVFYIFWRMDPSHARKIDPTFVLNLTRNTISSL